MTVTVIVIEELPGAEALSGLWSAFDVVLDEGMFGEDDKDASAELLRVGRMEGDGGREEEEDGGRVEEDATVEEAVEEEVEDGKVEEGEEGGLD